MKLALIGTGLIGSSAAAAWRRCGAVATVVGFDANPAAAAHALALKVVDRVAPSVAEAVREADLVLLAVPVGAMAAVLAQVARAAPAHSVITDVGSTKASVIEAARAALSAASSFSMRRFVPAHPIAGGEQPGVEHHDPELFRGKLCITTPLAETHADALASVEQLWRDAGARVVRMPADEHDRVFAAVSHLPHLLAFALVEWIVTAADGERSLSLAGAGFRDFTRIASSSPTMWRDIMLANRAAISAALRGYRGQLERLQQALDTQDGALLEQVFGTASAARRRQMEQPDGP